MKKPSRKPQTKTVARKPDAVALLKADHRAVEGWFKQFAGAHSAGRKRTLAQKICQVLRVHTTIEEEIFYPAFLDATRDLDLHHEAEVEHDAARTLIAQIEAIGPDDEYYDAKMTVLSEMIKHHVKEEEQPGGMFAEARKAGMDLQDLGDRLRARRQELMNGAGVAMSLTQRGLFESLLGIQP